jgi:hypothetical protein
MLEVGVDYFNEAVLRGDKLTEEQLKASWGWCVPAPAPGIIASDYTGTAEHKNITSPSVFLDLVMKSKSLQVCVLPWELSVKQSMLAGAQTEGARNNSGWLLRLPCIHSTAFQLLLS